MSGQQNLVPGQSLHIPVGVLKNTHNASTFKPYDPGETIGDTAPTSVTPKPPKKNKCGAFGQVLLVVIAAVVAYVAAPYAAAFFANTFGAGATLTAAGGGAVAATGTGIAAGTMTVGAGAMAAGGAVAGAAASIASQAVGVAFNIQEKFSWNAVAMAAIGGGVGGGMGLRSASGWGQAAANAAGQSVVSQGIAMAFGLQKKFSWAGVAAAGVSGGVGYKVGKGIEGALPAGKVGAAASTAVVATASSIAHAATRSAINGSNFGDNLRASIPDIIGQAIASGLMAPSLPRDPVEEQNARQANHASAQVRGAGYGSNSRLKSAGATVQSEPLPEVTGGIVAEPSGGIRYGIPIAPDGNILSEIQSNTSQALQRLRDIGDRSERTLHAISDMVEGTRREARRIVWGFQKDQGPWTKAQSDVVMELAQFAGAQSAGVFGNSEQMFFGVSLPVEAFDDPNWMRSTYTDDQGVLRAFVGVEADGTIRNAMMGRDGVNSPWRPYIPSDLGLALVIDGGTAASNALGSAAVLRAVSRPSGLKPVSNSIQATREMMKADLAAYRRLAKLQSSVDGAHFLKNHGAQTTLAQQYRRARYGIRPYETKQSYEINSTRFLTHQDQERAILEAIDIRNGMIARGDAVPKNGIRVQVGGEGFYAAKGNMPVRYGTTEWSRVRFDADGNPYTAYPELP